MLFAAVHESGNGTNRTNRAGLVMSVPGVQNGPRGYDRQLPKMTHNNIGQIRTIG
jgi:hypothetical protein